MTEKNVRPDVDWEAVEREYRAGIKSVRVIATEYDVSHVAIGKRAKKYDWPRDLSAKIRAATQAKLVTSEAVTASVTKASERDIIEANAAMQVAVVREHRKDIGRARGVTQRLMADLEAAIGNRETLEALIEEACQPENTETGKFDTKRYAAMMKAVALPEHISSVESLSRTLKNLIGIERQAFSIDDNAGAHDEPFEDRLKRLFYQQ
jgi:hypothetical protein